MQITHEWKTYRWIKHTFLWDILRDELYISENWTVMAHCENGIFITEYTPEQLVKLWYMELIETKPCEHDSDWYPLVCSHKCRCKKCWELYKAIIQKETKPEEKPTEEEKSFRDTLCFRTDKWVNIYDIKTDTIKFIPHTDHDKSMEIPEVPNMKREYVWNMQDILAETIHQMQLITNSLNAVIRKINNL